MPKRIFIVFAILMIILGYLASAVGFESVSHAIATTLGTLIGGFLVFLILGSGPIGAIVAIALLIGYCEDQGAEGFGCEQQRSAVQRPVHKPAPTQQSR